MSVSISSTGLPWVLVDYQRTVTNTARWRISRAFLKSYSLAPEFWSPMCNCNLNTKKWHSTTFEIIIILLSGKVIIIDQHVTITVTHVLWFSRSFSLSLYRTTCCKTSAITIKENFHMQPKYYKEHFFEWILLNLSVPGSQCFYLMLKLKNTSKESFVWPTASFKRYS